MTRPHIIRADTIDLQDHHAPSAKDHTRQPAHPSALGVGPPAPHQAETLREVAVEVEEEQHKSPRVSHDWENGGTPEPFVGSEQEDSLAIAQNGGLNGTEDAEMADAEGDDGLEDDMMDKISSSPSIDDGGYSIPQQWPQRYDSAKMAVSSASFPFLSMGSPSFLPSPKPDPMERAFSPSTALVRERKCQAAKKDPRSSLHKYRSAKSNMAHNDYEYDMLDKPGSPGKTVHPHLLRNQKQAAHIQNPREMLVVQATFQLSDVYEETSDSDIITFPYESSEDESDYSSILFPDDSRFIDSGWGGECLQESEDIDFDLVYALHTFVATVEGQANATKGDTMVLLDDSNSYWWLVRVVKDSSIGYLPAEHIETPTERLARLNKHRNIDLSATMLGDKDQTEKSKNPLKLAMRRRNAKTVTFSPPTYVEASDNYYSTDDEDDGEFYGQDQQQQHQEANGVQAEREDDDATLVESRLGDSPAAESSVEAAGKAALVKEEKSSKSGPDVRRTSEETLDDRHEGHGRSRNGVIRNTDSFFKDDAVETRKITLTPNLLRDDSSTSTRTSNDSKDSRQRPSLERLEKDGGLDKNKDDKKKKDKKEKDKKPGMLSNLFKRKDKKSKVQDEDIDELIYGKKQSTEESRASPVPSGDSGEYQPEEARQSQPSPHRPTSKLQKQPRPSNTEKQPSSPMDSKGHSPQDRQEAFARDGDAALRLVPVDSNDSNDSLNETTHPRSAFQRQNDVSSIEQVYKAMSEGGTQQVAHKAASDSDDTIEARKEMSLQVGPHSDETYAGTSTGEHQVKQPSRQAPQRPAIPGAFPDSYISTVGEEKDDPIQERLSESPVHVSHTDAVGSNPPALMVDTSSQEAASPTPSRSPSPDLVDMDERLRKKSSENSIRTSTSTSTWNDANLRTYFDDDTDIKELLLVVYDKSGVVPAGPDHPITGNLFKEENARLAEISNRLDSMLGDWLARKMKITPAR